MRGVFVTGTGTEVGKTVVAAAIARTAAEAGERVAVFKPALSGLDEYASGNGSVPRGIPDHELLRRASGSRQSDDEISPYRYGPAVSPHLAAELADERIDPRWIVDCAKAAAEGADLLVCEGVGGFCVPITSDFLVRDFAVDLGLPVVIAASPGLGTINHSLLTIESVRAAGLEVRAVVLTPWPRKPSAMEESNWGTIWRLGGCEVVGLRRLDLSDPGSWPMLHTLAGTEGEPQAERAA